MGWEDRSGNEYYYKKQRIGDRVISEYIGHGWLAETASTLDEIERLERELEREAWRQEQAEIRALEAEFNQVEDLTRALTRATMLLSGYHPHKGQWRKKRDERDNHDFSA